MDNTKIMDSPTTSVSNSSISSEEMPDSEALPAVVQEDVPVARSELNRDQMKDRNAAEATLAVNRKLDNVYKKLEDSLTERLKECHQKLEENAKLMASIPINKKKFSWQTFGKPYFKDRNMVAPPDNEDTIAMKKMGMYDFNNTLPIIGWTARDKFLFKNLLREMSINIRRQQLERKISTLEKKKKNAKQIAKIRKLINNLKQMSLEELALPIEQDYDWEAIAKKLQRHAPHEYKALWKIFLHPSINKGLWNRAEHQHLQKLVIEHNRQDWETIAAKLNTNRSAYQCYVYYRANIKDGKTGGKWTNEETEHLKRLVDFYKQENYIPWGTIANTIETRTKIQVYNKYQRLTEKRKGRFIAEEDSVILTFVDTNGLNFKKMSEYLPGRSATQLRIRYDLLTKMKVSVTWTVEEDEKLLQVMANQDSLSDFSMATPYFPDKDRSHIRSRYLTLQKWMKKHPEADISGAPRRGPRLLRHGRAHVNLKTSLEALAARMETPISETKPNKKRNRKMSEEDIEDCIMAFLNNEMLTKEAENAERRGITASGKDTVESNQRDTERSKMESLKNLLKLLSASLNKSKFTSSTEADQYPGLAEESTNLLQINTYSKKEVVRTVEVKEKTDIWGCNTLSKIEHVLPPNLSTITGFRVIMRLLGTQNVSQKGRKINLSQMARKNAVLREQMRLLKQRFNSLFLWTDILSNRSPLKEDQDLFYTDGPSTSKDIFSKYIDNDSNAN